MATSLSSRDSRPSTLCLSGRASGLLASLSRCSGEQADLTYGWMPWGRQMRVPSAARNRKQTVLGVFRHEGRLFYHYTQIRKTVWDVRALLQQLVKWSKRTDQRIILIMNRGNPYHAKALKRDLENVKEHVEMLWKHLKRSRMANVLFSSFKQLTKNLAESLDKFTSNPDFTLSITIPRCHKATRKKLIGVT